MVSSSETQWNVEIVSGCVLAPFDVDTIWEKVREGQIWNGRLLKAVFLNLFSFIIEQFGGTPSYNLRVNRYQV